MTRDVVQANLDQLDLSSAVHAQSTSIGAADSKNHSRGAEPRSENAGQQSGIFLSPVLMDVFRPFALGATTVEVVQALSLSSSTVQSRRQRVLKAYQTSSMFEAVQKAVAEGRL